MYIGREEALIFAALNPRIFSSNILFRPFIREIPLLLLRCQMPPSTFSPPSTSRGILRRRQGQADEARGHLWRRDRFHRIRRKKLQFSKRKKLRSVNFSYGSSSFLLRSQCCRACIMKSGLVFSCERMGMGKALSSLLYLRTAGSVPRKRSEEHRRRKDGWSKYSGLPGEN